MAALLHWLTGPGEDIHSEDGRFKVVVDKMGCVAVDKVTGEQSQLCEDFPAAAQWCEARSGVPLASE